MLSQLFFHKTFPDYIFDFINSTDVLFNFDAVTWKAKEKIYINDPKYQMIISVLG